MSSASLVLLALTLLGADARIDSPSVATVGVLTRIGGTDASGSLSWSTDVDVTIWKSDVSRDIVILCPTPRLLRIKQTAKDANGTSSDVAIIDFTGGPKPQPVQPDKPLAEGRFKIAQLARDKAVDVKTDQRKAEALLIAQRLVEVRDKIQTGEIKTENANLVTAEICRSLATLPAAVRTRWHDWGTAWANAVTAACNADQILTGTDWCVLLDETCAGLKAVK